MTFSRLMPTRAVGKYALCFLIGLASFQLYAQTSGLHIGAYHEDPTANPEDPTPGLLYLNLPAGDQSFKGLMDFTFVGCQSKSVGEIKGEKIKGSLKGEWSGPVDYTFQTGSYNGRYIAKDKYYTGTYVVNKGKQFVKVPNCIEYYIAPHGTWSIFELNHTFSESKPFEPIGVVDGVAKWSMPPDTTIASISVVDKDLAVSGAKNAVLHQIIIPASLKSYRLPAQFAKSGKTYVISVIASNGRKVVYFSSMEFPQNTAGKTFGVNSGATFSDKQPSGASTNTPTIYINNSVHSSSSNTAPTGVVPSMIGSEKPTHKPTEKDIASCAGTYEGYYDGEREGVMQMVVSSSGRSTSGFAATGGYDENVRIQDWLKKSESDGVKSFMLNLTSSDEVCNFNFAGTWMAPMSAIIPFRMQYMTFTGNADGAYMYGEYRFDANPSSPIMGRYRLKKVR